MSRAVVLGSGVIGMLTAEVLSRTGHDVTVVSQASYESSTSAAAVAVLVPFFPGDPASASFMRNLRWAEETLRLMRSLDIGEEFIEEITCYEFGADGLLEDDFPTSKLSLLTGEYEYELVPLERIVSGCDFAVRFRCNLCNVRRFLPALRRTLLARGVRFRQFTITRETLGQLAFDIAFNCLGSQSIFPDPELYAVFGQSMYIPADHSLEIGFGVGAGDHAVFAHRTGFHIGSYFLREPGRTPRRDLYERSLEFVRGPFLELCAAVGVTPPHLDLTKVEKVSYGLRPFRFGGPRLELDLSGTRPIVHNYGHGAHGWTIGYASVVEAVRLAGLAAPDA